MAVPIRIVVLLILAVGLASGRPLLVAMATLLLLLTWLVLLTRSTPFDWRGLGRMLRRVRWLLLAILILYGGFTGGEPVWPAVAAIPTVQGLTQGGLRIMALVAIVSAVHLLMWSTARGELLAGLLWFGTPLRSLGVDDQRFAARLVLTLEAVPQVQTLTGSVLERPFTDDPQAGLTARRLGAVLRRWSDSGRMVLQQALRCAEQAPTEIEIPDPIRVPIWQWSIPLCMAVGFGLLALQL